MTKDKKYKVCTRCMTYNQASYIEETMKGFCEQKTSFPVVYAIVDDASTDAAPMIITDYLNANFNLHEQDSINQKETDDFILFFARHIDNVNCYFLVLLLKNNHYQIQKPKDPYISEWLNNSLYVATCEGDDFWTDPLKLEKQVTYLENHPACSACATNSMIIDEKGNGKSLFSRRRSRLIRRMDEIVIKRQFHTASVLWRNSCLQEVYDKFTWDTYWWCTLLSNGPIWYDDSVTCVYRKAGQGVTSTTSTLKWIETNENWSNILYNQFSPQYLSYIGAYLSLTRDIIGQLVKNKTLTASDCKVLRLKYKKYTNLKIDLMNAPYTLKLFLLYQVVRVRQMLLKGGQE